MPISMPSRAPQGTMGRSVVVSVGKIPEFAKVMTASTPTTRPESTAVGIALSASTTPCHVVTWRRIEGFDRILGVNLLLNKRVSYPQARTAYDDRTPERPRVHIPIAMREKGSGRPTKKERRELDRLRGYDSHEHY